jgi:hypothetical protein
MNAGVANSIFVRGGDVYVAGTEELRSGSSLETSSAVLWKNNARQTLGRMDDEPDYGEYSASGAYGVTVSDSGVVYVAGFADWYGYIYSAGDWLEVFRAVLWVNGVPHTMHEGSIWDSDWYNGVPFSYTYPLDIAVSGNSVYAVGEKQEITRNDDTVGAVLMEMSVTGSLRSSRDIASGTGDSAAHSVHVSGGNVYIALWEYSSRTSSGLPKAKYYKNGTLTTLPGDRAAAYGISEHGGDVYVAGQEFDGGKQIWVAKYWKNSEPHTVGSGNANSNARKIVVK